MYRKTLTLSIVLISLILIAVVVSNVYPTNVQIGLPNVIERPILNFALKKEEATTRTKIVKAFPDRKFLTVNNKWYEFIIAQTLKYPLTLSQKLHVSNYAMRVLISLEPDNYITNSLDDIADYSPFLNIIHPHETGALDSSREYILKSHHSLYKTDYHPKQQDIELVLESAIAKEAYKFQLSVETKQSAIKLLHAFNPAYSYKENSLDDPLNDIVVVKTGPELFAHSLGGGTINIEVTSRTKEELGLTVIHEKLHIEMTNKFYQKYPSFTSDQADQGMQEISATALQYLLARKVELPTAIVEKLDYWDGARDLLVILGELKQRNLFDWEEQKDEFLLMAAEGDFKPIFKQYFQISGIPASSLDLHFGILRDKFFYNATQEEYSQTVNSFNKKSEELRIIQKFPLLYK